VESLVGLARDGVTTLLQLLQAADDELRANPHTYRFSTAVHFCLNGIDDFLERAEKQMEAEMHARHDARAKSMAVEAAAGTPVPEADGTCWRRSTPSSWHSTASSPG
jgi:hypothetical protein